MGLCKNFQVNNLIKKGYVLENQGVKEEKAKYIMKGLLETLENLHLHDVCHRDIKCGMKFV